MNKAMLAGGCFWGVEKYFQNLNGVVKTQVGYSGGHYENPTYENVCSGITGHAEVVYLEFNQSLISYNEVIEHFWQCHDPTQKNRQGFDIGTQYRSVIYYFTNTQKQIAEKCKINVQKNFSQPIVTDIEKNKKFYLAEEYHQCYLQKKT